jgi:hypothetical protein
LVRLEFYKQRQQQLQFSCWRELPWWREEINGITGYWSRTAVEFTVSQQFLRLRHGNSSGTQRKGNVSRWKLFPEDWWIQPTDKIQCVLQ